MARSYQYIRTKYFENARRASLSAEAILIELYLIMNRDCGLSGAQQVSREGIGYYIGYPIETVSMGLDELTTKGRIYQFPGSWVLVIGKWSNEPSKSPKVIKGLAAEMETLPKDVRNALIKLNPITFGNAIDTLSDTVSHTLPDTLSVPKPLEVEDRSINREKNKRESGKPDPPPVDSRFLMMVAELFPEMKSDDAMIGAGTLEKIERIDKQNLANIMPALRRAATDPTFFWHGVNFSNCKTLRDRARGAGTPMKYENIVSDYKKSLVSGSGGFPQYETIPD